MRTSQTIKPTRVARILLYVTLAVFCVTIVRSLLVFKGGYPSLLGLSRMLDVDREANLLSWYSSSLLLLAAMWLWWLAAAAKQNDEQHARNWSLLAIVFLFLSADEAACIHELAGEKLSALVPTSGYLLYVWVIPWGVMLLILGAASIRLLKSLPQQVRRMIVIGGALYVGGAIGMEMTTAKYMTGRKHGDLTYSMMVNVEEFLEMIGVVIFLYALAILIESRTASPDRTAG